ncbi:hypothetical protein Tco_0176581, partial [Tanacetum coccineum]
MLPFRCVVLIFGGCYKNRVLVTKPHNKTPYELFLGRKPALGFMRPFGCPVTILNTIDHLGRCPKSSPDAGFKPSGYNEKKVTEEPGKEGGDPSNKNDSVNSTNNINTVSDGNSTNNVNTVSLTINTAGIEVNTISSNTSIELLN